MASSSKPEGKYDVFLSFRGTDLRNNFLSHLYKALDQNGMYTFVDSEEMRKGDQISPTLMKAIEQSCIAIIIFSEDYASSKWCLEEVARIMECKEQKNLTVLPIFYKVEPSEVRVGRESYARALAKQENKFGEDSKEVKRWKKALFDAGSLSGWHQNDGNESELIQEIVKKISTYLARPPLHVAKHPVGINSRVIKLKSMLSLESDDGVLMVGLWGQGGIGKSSLAKAIYNEIFRQFEGSSFLENVRETSKECKDLVTLQEKLLSEILKLKQRLVVSSESAGTNLIRDRLCHKKVLLVLDDVDDLRQLNALAGKGEWFGNGSRIIVTTRDEHLLTCHRIGQDHVYEVQALDDNEAQELLSQHAFLTHQAFKIRIDLVKSVLYHANGLPLALEVLGSFLCGRSEHEWESTLKELSRVPNNRINGVLKISYDGLQENEKEIFLDLACFFKGKSSEYVKKVVDSCYLGATIGLKILFERSLIRNGSTIEMHDLIQSMGMEIVNQDKRDNPGKRSRLWRYGDVFDVLSSYEGDCVVKAIVLEPPKPTEMCINRDAFTKMRRLRLLILRNVHDSLHGPVCLPSELRWFEWPGCACKIPEFSSGPKKIAGLYMSEGNITRLLKQIKAFQYLKYINFSFCKLLVRMPDLSGSPNLEELDLHNCKNLVEAHESIAYLDKLKVLNFWECSKLRAFPNELRSKNLQTLNFGKCPKFERFPDIPHKQEALKELHLRENAIKGLPVSIENLVSLEIMSINDCMNLKHLPTSIYKLQNLKELRVERCTHLAGFPKYEDSADPCMKTGLSNLCQLHLDACNLTEVEFLENLSCLPSLEFLNLNGNNITSIPTSINKRDRLSLLCVGNCHQLQGIPKLPPFLEGLQADNCESVQNYGDLTSFHDFVRRALTTADISSSYPYTRYSLIFPAREIPKWILPIEEESRSFMTSEDLYDKFLGIALCVVCHNDGRKGEDEYSVLGLVNGKFGHFNGKFRGHLNYSSVHSELDHVQLQYLIPSSLWGEVDFGRIDRSRVQFSIAVYGEVVRKWGFRIICKPLEDDLKVVLQDNQLIDPALLIEVGFDSTDPEAESSHMHEDSPIEIDLLKNSQDCQMSTTEHSQIVPKRNHGLFSLEACEPRPRGLLIRLAEMSMAMFGCCFCVWIEDNQPMDPALLCEVGHDPIDSEAESSHMHKDSLIEMDLLKNFQDCQMSTEEHVHIGSKSNHELILPQGWLHL